MSPDAELMLIFGVLHLIAIALGALLFVMFLRSETTERPAAARGRGRRRRRQRSRVGEAQGLPVRRPAAARRRRTARPPALPRAPGRPQAQARAPAYARPGAALAPSRNESRARPAATRLIGCVDCRRARRVANVRPCGVGPGGIELPARRRGALGASAPRRLAREVAVAQQALLVQGRRRARVAALPARAHAELVQRPVDRAAQPGLGGVDAEVEVDEVLLEGPGALLLDRAVAVGLRAELRDHQGLVGVALADRVEVGAQLRAVEDRPVGAGVPAEVLVDADHVERRVLGLAADAGIAGHGDADGPRRIERLGLRDGMLDVGALHGPGARRELVGDRPQHHRRVVLVGQDVLLELLGRELAHQRLLEVLGLDRVDRHLRPDQHAPRGRRARACRDAAGSACA